MTAPLTTAPLLEVRGLSVQYRRRRAVSVAVDDVSFAVSPGETVGVVGESGSGKTTITRAILGLTAIRSGEVLFGGQDVTSLDVAGRRRLYRQVQLVFQDPYSSLNPSRTVGRTLAEPLQAYGEKDAALVRTRVREMLERVQLPDGTADRYPGELSGGQRQRVAIARALMLSPRLVILDEPLSALDLSAQAQILNLLRELQSSAGLSYLFISHDLEVVRYLCDRVVVMYQGRVMETGPADLVSGQSAHPYTRMLHQASPVADPRSQRRRHTTEAVLSLRGIGAAAPGRRRGVQLRAAVPVRGQPLLDGTPGAAGGSRRGRGRLPSVPGVAGRNHAGGAGPGPSRLGGAARAGQRASRSHRARTRRMSPKVRCTEKTSSGGAERIRGTRVRAGGRGVQPQFHRARRPGRLVRRHARRRAAGGPLGRNRRPRERTGLDRGHAPDPVLRHQGTRRRLRVAAYGAGSARTGIAGRAVLAGVRGRGQIGRARPGPRHAHCRPARTGRSCDLARGDRRAPDGDTACQAAAQRAIPGPHVPTTPSPSAGSAAN